MIRLQVTERLKDLVSSYWFVPLVCAFGAIALVGVAAWFDSLAANGAMPVLSFFAKATPGGRRALLSTIAGSSIAVAGTVFSISMVVLSSASAQLGPRLLPNFFKRISTQFVLGGFIATFLAALLVLAQVSDTTGGPNPHSYGIGLSVLLAVLSVALLVYFLQSVSLFIQAPLVIDDVAYDLVRVLRQQTIDSASKSERWRGDISDFLRQFEGNCARIDALGDGYIQAIDTDRGCQLAADYDVRIKLPRRPGRFVSTHDTLALILPASSAGDELEQKIRELVVVGAQRTNSQDIEYVVDQIVEIAVRALSPGINDPITAINCIDRLGGALGTLAEREFPSNVCTDEAGNPRLYVERLTDKGVLDAAFNQIRQHASRDVAVSARLIEMIASLGKRVSRESFKQGLHDQLEQHFAACQRDIDGESDRHNIEERYHAAMKVLGVHSSGTP